VLVQIFQVGLWMPAVTRENAMRERLRQPWLACLASSAAGSRYPRCHRHLERRTRRPEEKHGLPSRSFALCWENGHARPRKPERQIPLQVDGFDGTRGLSLRQDSVDGVERRTFKILSRKPLAIYERFGARTRRRRSNPRNYKYEEDQKG
jgi:hypothetical protein